MSGIQFVTLKEAQFILERPQEELQRAIDRGEVERLTTVVSEPAPPSKSKGRKSGSGRRRKRTSSQVFGYQAPRTVKRNVRQLGEPELLYFLLEKELHQDLSPAGRRRLYAAVKQSPRARRKFHWAR
jgi:hypothetical protein